MILKKLRKKKKIFVVIAFAVLFLRKLNQIKKNFIKFKIQEVFFSYYKFFKLPYRLVKKNKLWIFRNKKVYLGLFTFYAYLFYDCLSKFFSSDPRQQKPFNELITTLSDYFVLLVCKNAFKQVLLYKCLNYWVSLG